MAVNRKTVMVKRKKYLVRKGMPKYRAQRLLYELARARQRAEDMRNIANAISDGMEGMDDDTAWCSPQLAAMDAAYGKMYAIYDGMNRIIDEMGAYGLKIRA